jgi:hypothetical protein
MAAAQATYEAKRYYLGIYDSKAEALQAVRECETYGPSTAIRERNDAKLRSGSSKRKALVFGNDPKNNIYKNNYTDSAQRRAKQAKFVPDVDVTASPKKSKDVPKDENKGKPKGKAVSKKRTRPTTKESANVDIEFF